MRSALTSSRWTGGPTKPALAMPWLQVWPRASLSSATSTPRRLGRELERRRANARGPESPGRLDRPGVSSCRCARALLQPVRKAWDQLGLTFGDDRPRVRVIRVGIPIARLQPTGDREAKDGVETERSDVLLDPPCAEQVPVIGRRPDDLVLLCIGHVEEREHQGTAGQPTSLVDRPFERVR